MKKLLIMLLTLVLAVGLSVPMATPVMSATGTVTVNSDTTVQIVGVYNKAGGVSAFVDLSGSPLNAVRAQEPKPYPTGYVSEGPEVTNSVWDTGVDWSFQTNAPSADWIWETERAEGPATVYAPSDSLYDDDASKWGRVVVFQKTFTINGTPINGGSVNITADNCYEVWINGQFLARSATAKVAGWETSNLHETSVATTGWQTVGHHTIPAAMLQNGDNTLVVLAGDEYYHDDDGNSPVPAYVSNPYRQMNPGAVIFSLTAIYEEEVAEADLEITKVAAETEVDAADDVIHYTIEVENTGNVTITGVSVSDPLLGTLTRQADDPGNNDNNLEVGETWVYTGTYTVLQSDIDNNGNPTPGSGLIENTATVSSNEVEDKTADADVDIITMCKGRMTGGGSVFKTDGTRVTHGFELHCDISKEPNNLEINWGNGKGNKFHLEKLTAASCSDDPSIVPNPPKAGFDTYKGEGTGRYNGVPGATAKWTFTDAGEPGKNDSAEITIWDAKGNLVLYVKGNLKNGNQQAHAK